jgi:hypothetical protein
VQSTKFSRDRIANTLVVIALSAGILMSICLISWILRKQEHFTLLLPSAISFASSLGLIVVGPISAIIQRMRHNYDGLFPGERVWMMLGLLWIAAFTECLLVPRILPVLFQDFPGLLAGIMVCCSCWMLPLPLWKMAHASWWQCPAGQPNWQHKLGLIAFIYYICCSAFIFLTMFLGFG